MMAVLDFKVHALALPSVAPCESHFPSHKDTGTSTIVSLRMQRNSWITSYLRNLRINQRIVNQIPLVSSRISVSFSYGEHPLYGVFSLHV